MNLREINAKNQTSIFNQIPEESVINRGVLFYQFTHIMTIYSGIFQSKSGLFLKISGVSGNKIESDNQFIRNLNNGSLTEEDVIEFISHLPKKNLSQVHSLIKDNESDEHFIGGWLILDSLIRGFQKSNEILELNDYLEFLLAISNIDKELIIDSHGTNNEQRPPTTQAELAKPWLSFSKGYNSSSELNKGVEYLIAIVLHWTALFENLIILDWPELVDRKNDNGSPFTFQNYAPKIKNRKVIHSVNTFLARLKQQFGKITPDSRPTWEGLYETIAKNDPNNSSYSSIEKQFNRWKNGSKKMTVRSFDKLNEYMVSLMLNQDELDEQDQYHGLIRINAIITFIQLFDRIQRDLIKEGISPEFIVEQFDRYPLYLDMVSRRYQNFCKNGIVIP